MRILFVSGCYLPTTNGVTYHIQLLKKALEARGHTVYLLTPQFSGYKDTEKNIIRYPSIPNPLFPNLPIGIPMYSLKEIARLKIDIVHTHHPFVASALATQISDFFGLPLFWTNHTRYEEYINHYLPNLSGLSHKALSVHLRDVASKCQKVICPSSISLQILRSYGIKNTKIVYNGIDTSNFIPNPDLKSKQLSLIYVGRIEKEKNIRFLLQVAQQLFETQPNFHLTLIGDGKELSIFREEVQKLGLTESISLPGSLPREKLVKFYQSAHMFISPSTTEVMPLTFIEALSCGLPIICLKKSGVDKFLPKNPSIIPLPPSPKIITKYISQLDHLDHLSALARSLGEQYDISQTAKTLEKIYSWHLGQK